MNVKRLLVLFVVVGFVAVSAYAETIEGYFQCVDDEAVSGAYVSLGSDGSCTLKDPNNGTVMSGTYEILGIPSSGWSGTIIMSIDGQSFDCFIGWPTSGNPVILMDGWTFEER